MPERILDINGSAEPAILAGMEVYLIPGDEGNFKITTPGDLERFQKMMSENGMDSSAGTDRNKEK